MLKINNNASPVSTSHIVRKKFQILRHDKQLHEDKPLENNGKTKPFFKGIFLHLGIVGVIILSAVISNLMGNSPTMVETSLISANELANVQRQISASRRQAKKAGKSLGTVSTNVQANQQSAPNVTTQNTPQIEEQTAIKKLAKSLTEIFAGNDSSSHNEPPITVEEHVKSEKVEKPQPSKEAIDLKKKLAEREAQFKKALQSFTQKEEEKTRKKMQAEQEKRQVINEQKLIESFKEKQNNIEKVVVKEKKKTQEEIEKQKQEDLATQQRNEKILIEKYGENNEGDASGFEPVKSMSLGIPSAGGDATESKANALQAVATKIQRHLHPPFGSGGDISEAKITVNSRGEVTRVYISKGENGDLNKAVEQAIYSASPLPIDSDDKHYPIFSITFKGEGDK
ncbi:MAG: TonB C-terminal domain-containing protein [Moraxellaceae bacterium]|nr:TonB C-terminal domain-containing protein [Moraxellaceae bacterium]MBS9779106.1 TonB C-terminal domain-containing protein [Moraxellaceae bacterium]